MESVAAPNVATHVLTLIITTEDETTDLNVYAHCERGTSQFEIAVSDLVTAAVDMGAEILEGSYGVTPLGSQMGWTLTQTHDHLPMSLYKIFGGSAS